MPELSYQPSIAFTGIETALAARVVLTHGVSPNRFFIDVAPQDDPPPAVGDLTIGYGATALGFSDCKLDAATVSSDDEGVKWTLCLLDRRWRWVGLGQVSGRYNIYQDTTTDGLATSEIVSATERTPQELLTLCLDALGETGYDVSSVPNDARPTADWDYTPPAAALANLADLLGCRVVLRLDNTVAVVPWGDGSSLPLDDSLQAGSLTVNVVERPDTLIVLGGPTRYQVDLALEAVGLDIDGTIKPIDELSYTPTDWLTADVPFFNNVGRSGGSQPRQLAQASVFRWYRVCGMVTGVNDDGTMQIGDLSALEVTSLDQILPLEPVQIDQCQVGDPLAEDERIRQKPAVVWGIWNEFDYPARRDDSPNGNVVAEIESLTDNASSVYASRARCPGPWELDLQRGIVKFARPMYRWKLDGSDIQRLPAQLVLRTSFSIRNAETLARTRYEHSRSTSGTPLGTLPRYLRHDELTLTQVYRYDAEYGSLSIEDNSDALTVLANNLLDAAEAQYAQTSPQVYRYSAILPIELDGAIARVAWTVDRQGAVTQAWQGADCTALDRRPQDYWSKRGREQLRQLSDRLQQLDVQGVRDLAQAR